MLTREDFHTRTWERFVELARERLQAHREANDRPQNTELQTAIVRGRIQELKDLLALANRSAPASDAGSK